MDVIVYTTPTCRYCDMAKKYLSQKGIPFIEKDVSRDQAAATEMASRSGQQGVPVIVVGDKVVVGFNSPLLEQLLAPLAGATARRSLGVSVANAAKYVPSVERGAYVGRVRHGSPAERTGLQKGDVIVELAGRPVDNADALVSLSQGLTPGQAVPVVVLRNGRRLAAQLRI
jgi:glutaredoxin 3